jgi:hypothetical protein
MNYNESVIKRSVELIILLSSIIAIAFMITGGCGDGGKGGQPGPTGPPPGCEPIVIDPECPSLSLTELCSFWGYTCDLTEQNPGNIEPETIPITFQPSSCISMDCFAIECEASFGQPPSEIVTITFDIMEIDTGTLIAPPEFSGTADLDGTVYDFVCPPQPIP